MYNAYFWDNSIVNNLMISILNWWLFGIFVIALVIFFSIMTKTYSTVLIATAGVNVLLYVISFISKIKYYLPITLMETNGLLSGIDSTSFIKTIIVSLVLVTLLLVILIPTFNKKEILKGITIIFDGYTFFYTLKQLLPINSLIKELHGIQYSSSIVLKYFKYFINLFATKYSGSFIDISCKAGSAYFFSTQSS